MQLLLGISGWSEHQSKETVSGLIITVVTEQCCGVTSMQFAGITNVSDVNAKGETPLHLAAWNTSDAGVNLVEM